MKIKYIAGTKTRRIFCLLTEPAQPSKNCPRANGFFAWPAEESCQKFWDCRGGKSYLQICPEGVIFDMKIDACVTPDQAEREDCKADKFLKYDCPKYSAEEWVTFEINLLDR